MEGFRMFIVVSDLHLAPERSRGLFQADAELSSFLLWILEEAPGSTVILNGDVVDFLVIESSDSVNGVFDHSIILRRASAIVDYHPEVFDALSKLARSPHHHLVILSGNHDPELIFPEVRQVFDDRLCGSIANPGIRWLVNGEAAQLSIGPVRAVIEHGDNYDDWNRINRDELRKALSLTTRGLATYNTYEPPPGSQLVIEYITPLREQFPWVDLLKPERDAVIPIVFAFLTAKEQYKLRGALRPWLASFRRSLVSNLRRTLNPTGIYRAASTFESSREVFIEWLDDIEKAPNRSLSNEDKFRRLIPQLRKVSAEDNFLQIESPDTASQDVAFLLQQGVDLVVHGHTHSAKAYKLGKGLYLNDGTWAKLMNLPSSIASDDDWHKFLNNLSQGISEGFLRPTFVRIAQEGSDEGSIATLMQWSKSGPSCSAKWRFVPVVSEWERLE